MVEIGWRSVWMVVAFVGLCAVSEASNDESTHTNNWAVIVSHYERVSFCTGMTLVSFFSTCT